jgi:FAD/FMN-containing dehydrogenase
MAAIDRRQFLVGGAGGAILLRLPAEPAGFSRHALRELRTAVRGRVLVPRGSAALVYNTRFDGRRPDAVVQVRDTADVAAAVRWANRFDVPLVARSGGHSYAGYCTTADGVVLDLSRLRGIRVSGGRATVGPAAQLIDVQRALTRRGRTVPSGSCPTVGIGGLTLGGGHGLAGRRFGLTSDNLLAARVVTADGRVRHVDADTNEDLFWACRGGGGGNFGVVTSLTLRTHRAAGAAYFFVSWPWSQAGEAIAAWQRFAPHAPPGLTSILSLGTTGGSGTPRVAALGQYFGEPSALARLVRPLTRVAGASLSTGSSSYFTMVLR